MTAAPTSVLFDTDAEDALIDGALVWPQRVETFAADVAPEHFHDLRNAVLWSVALEFASEGVRPDPVLVVDRARQRGTSVTSDAVAGLMRDALPLDRAHVEVVLRAAAARTLYGLATEGRVAAEDGTDPYATAARLAADLDRLATTAARREPEALTMPALVAGAEAAAPWVVDGLLREDWRAVVVAAEGVGKSTLLRQIAVLAAQGVHPLRFDRIDPVPTLVVDAENPRAAIGETGGSLDAQVRRAVGADYDERRCLVWSRPGGLDLRNPRDRGDPVRELRAARPRLVVAGPVYKLGRRHERESYEDAAEGVLAVLDDLRTRFGFALVLEHHAPKSQGGYRDLVPFGSQRWLAWPELGLSLRAERDGTGLRVGRFRGDRLVCSWPDKLERGGVWPWQGVWLHGRTGVDI
ncbi:MAG TPA: AAA family ATPase [Acidimicrobiales bacterium]|nr:AAA family ATPase [Acidimicrobiales bacterium]